MLATVAVPLLLAGAAKAHLFAWANGMYCKNGTVAGVDNVNNDAPVPPLYNMSYNDYWMHAYNGCTDFPPADGEYLELPAGGSFQVEIAENRAYTSLSFNGAKATNWGDGQNHPNGYSTTNLGGAALSTDGCLSTPNMHTQNQSNAAGSAFAIAYVSDISQATPSNMAIFSVAYNTPYELVATFDVPANMPACPADGCICAWGWVPNGCGQFNLFMGGYKCMVTGATATAPVAAPKPPVWCQDDSSNCTAGAKQMILWNQLDGNNVFVSGVDDSGNRKHPGYNEKMGFANGAQNDIFESGSSSSGSSNQASSQAPASSSSAAAPPASSSQASQSSYVAPPPASSSSADAASSSAAASSAASSAAAASSIATSMRTAPTCSTKATKARRNVHRRLHHGDDFN
jgi:hypothetical protein